VFEAGVGGDREEASEIDGFKPSVAWQTAALHLSFYV
jgi:hypothetical protein